LIADFALGPNQGQGVPAVEDTDGLSWDLFPYNISVPIGGHYGGQLPGWGSFPLHAVTVGLVTQSQNISLPAAATTRGNLVSLVQEGTAPSLPGDLPSSRVQLTLATDSLRDITNQVTSDGYLDITFSSNLTGIEYNIFVTYLVHSDFRAEASPLDLTGPETSPTSFVQNGSWSVDHYSAAGAMTTTSFWEKYLLDNDTRSLLEAVGEFGWEDSIEIRSNLQWTQNFSQSFLEDHDYAVNEYLPLFFHQNRIIFDGEQPIWWITDEADSGNSHIADYRTTVSAMSHDELHHRLMTR